MSAPNITDWMQGGGTLAAIVMSAASLIWQGRAAWQRRQARIQIEADDQGPYVWLAKVHVTGLERNFPLTLQVTVLNKKQGGLFQMNDVPQVARGDGNYSRDYGVLMDKSRVHKLDVSLLHDRYVADTATALFGMMPGDRIGAMRVKLTAKTEGSRWGIVSRTLTVSPIH